MIRPLWHRLAHILGFNTGIVASKWEGERLLIAFQCGYCGVLDDIHESPTTRGAS